MSVALEVLQPQQQLQRRTLEPNTMAEAKEFAELAAKSDLVPKDYKGNAFNILIAIQFGKELGVQPMQALQGIAVINGRPSVWGDLQLAIVKSHPECEDVEEDDMADIRTHEKATCIVKRKGKKPVKRSFSKADAVTAKLWDKDGPWKTYPYRMLQMRARGFALRDAFPDALKGLISVEEAGDYEGPTIEGPFRSIAEMPPLDEPITQDEAREFGKAWKASGRTIEQAKAWLKEALSTDSSLKIRKSQLQKAMAWAKNEQPAPAEQNGNGNAEPHDKKLVFELFGILRYDDVQRAQAVKDHTVQGASTDWKTLALELEKQLPVEG
jgi:hypothetical protein